MVERWVWEVWERRDLVRLYRKCGKDGEVILFPLSPLSPLSPRHPVTLSPHQKTTSKLNVWQLTFLPDVPYPYTYLGCHLDAAAIYWELALNIG